MSPVSPVVSATDHQRVNKMTGLLPIEDGLAAEFPDAWNSELTRDELAKVASCIEWTTTFPRQKVRKRNSVAEAICPFLSPSLSKNRLFFAAAKMKTREPELSELDSIFREAADAFESGLGVGDDVLNCLVVVLPGIRGSCILEATDPSRDIKDDLLRRGILIGEFFPSCPFATTFNPKLFALRSPAPMIVLRKLIETDWRFICGVPRWQVSYREQFGSPPKGLVHLGSPVWRFKQKVLNRIAFPALGRSGLPTQLSEGFELVVSESAEEFSGLRNDWNRLLPKESGPFQTFDWNQLWYEYLLSANQKPIIFSLKRRDEVIAIFACYIVGKTIRPACDSTCDFQDVIAANESDAGHLLSELVKWLASDRPSYHLHFSKCSTRGYLHNILVGDNIPTDVAATNSRYFAPSPYVSIEGGLDEYLKRLTRNKRSDIRKAINRLKKEEQGYAVNIYRHGEISAEKIEEVADFHVEHFRMKGTDPLSAKSLREFLVVVADSPEPGLQIATLKIGGRLVAVDIGFSRNETYSGYLTSFDNAFGQYRPGKCLVALRIDQWVDQDGIKILDLMSGNEGYKSRFTTGDLYEIYNHRILPHSLRNQILHLAVKMFHKAKDVKNRWLTSR